MQAILTRFGSAAHSIGNEGFARLFFGSPCSKGYLDELRRKAIPIVMLDRFPSGYPVNCVTCNNHDGAYEAVEYLIRQGHRRIGFAAYDFHLSPEIERYNGYRSAISNASLPIADERIYLEKELDYGKLADQIRRGEMTALFCANDKRALELPFPPDPCPRRRN